VDHFQCGVLRSFSHLDSCNEPHPKPLSLRPGRGAFLAGTLAWLSEDGEGVEDFGRTMLVIRIGCESTDLWSPYSVVRY
jgi:hypothetical protein